MEEVNSLNIVMNQQNVGRLILTKDGLCAFEYDANFLTKGFSISPFHLPLEKKVFIARPTPFSGNFGVFNDSLPDGWGNLLLDRYLHKKAIAPNRLTQLQRLALIGTSGRGALEYHPVIKYDEEDKRFDLHTLANDAQKILETEYNGSGLDTLYQKGGSSGGARPKVFIKIDEIEWLIKFKASSDPENIGEIEYHYAQLAQKCGIEMAEVHLFEGKYFGVKRFDRTAEGKIHTISAAGLLNADYRIPSLDYEMLLKACLLITKDMKEVVKLFRIMVFNVVISNRDDHAKNFAFQFIGGQWRLSPAYDLLPSEGFNGFHTTTVNNNGNPTKKDILIVAEKIGISNSQAQLIVEEIGGVCEIKKFD